MKYLILLSIVFFTAPVSAEILKWVDADGKVHFGDKVPEKYKTKSNEVIMKELNVVKTENQKKNRPYVQPENWLSKQVDVVARRNAELAEMEKNMQQRNKANQEHYETAVGAYLEKREVDYKREQPCNMAGAGFSKKKEKKYRADCKRNYIYNPN
jgi:hypothetical protein